MTEISFSMTGDIKRGEIIGLLKVHNYQKLISRLIKTKLQHLLTVAVIIITLAPVVSMIIYA